MMVSATWFLWDLLYASTSRWLNWSVAERTHMVSLVPSSGLLLVVELLLLPPPHAAMLNARTATAAALMGPRQSLPDAISSPLTTQRWLSKTCSSFSPTANPCVRVIRTRTWLATIGMNVTSLAFGA